MQDDIRRQAEKLRLEKGINLQIRVGLNTGEVVLRSIRKDDLHTDYVPIGHSTSLAARMEALATPGSIVASEQTQRLSEEYFQELQAAMGLSRLWQEQGKRNEAQALLGEIYGWFTEGFDTADLKEAKALLEELA